MQNYRIEFYRTNKDEESEDKKEEFLGSVVVEDTGTDRDFTLLSKGFRQAQVYCLLADKTIIRKI